MSSSLTHKLVTVRYRRILLDGTDLLLWRKFLILKFGPCAFMLCVRARAAHPVELATRFIGSRIHRSKFYYLAVLDFALAREEVTL
jgi:hypothetical protein